MNDPTVSTLTAELVNSLHKLYVQKTNLNVTGGGAYKFEDLVHNELGVHMTKLDEMDMLGMSYSLILKVKLNCDY